MAQVTRLLEPDRLVTLTGPPGIGKTRLAIEVGAKLARFYPDGGLFVDLAPLSKSVLVSQAVASALVVREEPGHAVEATLISHLRDRSLLIVLDNCEHLIDACAELVEMLLRECQHLRVLAMSREALRIPGERETISTA